MSEVLHTACRLFQVTPDELCGPSRSRRVAHARFALAWAMRQHDPSRSFAAIGEMLVGRDHATILHAIERAEELACIDIDYALCLAELWPCSEGTAHDRHVHYLVQAAQRPGRRPRSDQPSERHLHDRYARVALCGLGPAISISTSDSTDRRRVCYNRPK